jgi:predicted site-specific integrase-resolvase
MPEKLVSIEKAAELMGVGKSTLRSWDDTGKFVALRTPGGFRRYRMSDIQKFQGIQNEENHRPESTAVYLRVSSHDQKKKGDIERQKGRVLGHCANKNYQVIHILEEVGSGMCDNRSKLKRLFKLAIDQQINRVIIEHKDRLTRFNFGVYEIFFKSHGVELEWVENVLPKSYEAELVEDLISLMSSFSARIYGKRSAENARKKKEAQDANK